MSNKKDTTQSEENSNDNVIPFEDNKDKKNVDKEKGSEEAKKLPPIKNGIIQRWVCQYLMKENKDQYPPYVGLAKAAKKPFDIKFYSHNQHAVAVRLSFTDEEKKIGTVEHVSKEEVQSQIRKCLKRFDTDDIRNPKSYYNLSVEEIEKCEKNLRLMSHKYIEEPQSLGFKSTEGVFKHRCKFDPKSGALTKFYQSFLDRFGKNAVAFCQFIGRIYDDKSGNRQALYIEGEKKVGKSTILNILKYISGGSDKFKDDKQLYNPPFGFLPSDVGVSIFDLEHLVMARVILGDEINRNYVSTNVFKQTTSSTGMVIRGKGARNASMTMNAKTVLVSNHPPELKSDDAVLSRLLHIKLKRFEDEGDRLTDHEGHVAMVKGAPEFVQYCLDRAKEVKDDSIVLGDTTAIEEAIESSNEVFQNYFDEFFEEPRKLGFLEQTEMEQNKCCSTKEFTKVIKHLELKNRVTIDKMELKSFIKSKLKKDSWASEFKRRYPRSTKLGTLRLIPDLYFKNLEVMILINQ